MSLLPLIVNFTDNDMERDLWSHPMFQFMAPLYEKRACGGYKRKWSLADKKQAAPCQHQICPMRDQLPVSTMGKDGFQISLDVQHFAPNEISVKTVDHYVVIEANHEEKQDDQGFVSRHFVRRYMLPEEYDVQQVVSSLSSDGVLTVKAAPPTPKEKGERVVQIQQTGPAHLSVKQNPVPAAPEEERKKDEEANKME